MNTNLNIIAARGRLGQILFGNKLFALVLLASFCAANAQTWLSLQQGDVRTGSDWATVNTAGTLVTTNYNTSITGIRPEVPDSNLNAVGINYWLGTGCPGGGGVARILAAWDLTPIVNYVGGNAFVISGADVHLTQLDGGQNFGNAGMAICAATGPFYDESVATWNSPGPGQPAGGAVTVALQNLVVASITATYRGPRVMTWTNIASTVGAALGNPTNKTAYFLFKRNNESAPTSIYNHPIVTDENTAFYHSDILGDDFGGIDSRPELQVQVTILSNAPLVSVDAVTSEIWENRTNQGVFTISRSINITNELTVTFSIRNNASLGDAQDGIDYTASEYGSVTLPANVTSTNIYITPINDFNIEDDQNIILTVYDSTGINYGIVKATAKIVLHQDNVAHTLLDYMFSSLPLSPRIWDTNVTATTFASPRWPFQLGSAGQSVSVPSAAYVSADDTANSEGAALTSTPASYAATTLTPSFGHVLTLTNIQFASQYLDSGDPGLPVESVWFIRSSLDDFTTTLASFTNPVTYSVNFQTFNLPLGPEFSNLGNVTFRFYLYDDSTSFSLTLTYIDNLFFIGQTAPLSAGQQQIAITASAPDASEPSTPGAFTVTRTTNDMTAALNVSYMLSGTASNGVDYTSLSGVATIPAGTNNTVVVVSPISGALVGGNKTVIMMLQSAFPNVIVWGTGSATVTIAAAVIRPAITQITIGGGNVEIQFSDAASDAASSFHLQSSTTVNGTYTDDNSALITGSAGAFQATTAVNGATQFYRIRR